MRVVNSIPFSQKSSACHPKFPILGIADAAVIAVVASIYGAIVISDVAIVAISAGTKVISEVAIMTALTGAVAISRPLIHLYFPFVYVSLQI